MRFVLSLTALLLVPGLCLAGERSHMRGERYCEVIISKSLSRVAVYNTIGLNVCPEEIWQKLTVQSVKKETHAAFVHLNGPRFWVIDGLESSTLVNPVIKVINGLAMREAAILNVSLTDLFLTQSYKEREVDRHTTWIYDSGKPIYELIDPHNNVFVMQSFSIQKYAQTESSLSELGKKLHLPNGWKFKTGVTKQEEKLPAINNVALVVQDDFLNTYQKATHDFLNDDTGSK